MKAASVPLLRESTVPFISLVILVLLIPYIIMHHTIYTTQYIFVALLSPGIISRIMDHMSRALEYLSIPNNRAKVFDWMLTILSLLVTTFVVISLGIPSVIIAFFIPKRKTQLVRFIIWLNANIMVYTLGAILHIDGSIPKKGGPYVVVANHTTFLDYFLIIIILGYKTPWTILYGTNLEKYPILGYFLKKYGVGVDRTNSDSRQAASEAMRIALSRGLSVAVFPEGTRKREFLESHKGKRLLGFHNGSFASAVEGGHTVIPVAISGGTLFRSPDHLFPFSSGDIFITFTDPISSVSETAVDIKIKAYIAIDEILISKN